MESIETNDKTTNANGAWPHLTSAIDNYVVYSTSMFCDSYDSHVIFMI